MSRNSRRSHRRFASLQRSQQKSWLRRYLRALSSGVAAASIGVATLMGQPASAANRIWQGNTDVNWATATNWNLGLGPAPVTLDSLEFGVPGTAGLGLIDNLTTGTATFTIAGITFTGAAGAYTINPAGAGNTFTLTTGVTNSSASLQTINSAFAL